MDQYRGQNANMHACEAALWAFEATGKIDPYLNRARTLAHSVAKNLASKTIATEQNSQKTQNAFLNLASYSSLRCSFLPLLSA